MKSLDLSRTVPDFGFGNLTLGSDGTFSGYDGGNAEGAFFGPAHQEAVGMFFKNDNQISGSFGAIREEQGEEANDRNHPLRAAAFSRLILFVMRGFILIVAPYIIRFSTQLLLRSDPRPSLTSSMTGSLPVDSMPGAKSSAAYGPVTVAAELSNWGRSTRNLLYTLCNLARWKISLVTVSGMVFEIDTPHGR